MGGGLWLSTFSLTASAEGKSINDTTVDEDLKDVDLSNYPYNPLGDCEIISVMEYAYSEKEEYKDDYNLYIYVYNPTCKDISLAPGVNFVSVGVQYSITSDGDICVHDHEKFELECVSKESDNRFYKFKLKDSSKMYSVAWYTQFSYKLRVYDITELEIRHLDNKDSIGYDISTRYVWTGYGANCGPDNNAKSTLQVKNYSIRSIHLELYDTYYRFETQSDGVTQDTLNSVYFEVPVEYFHEFGNLHKIKAQWYEYKTKPIFVTSELAAYQELFNWRNEIVGLPEGMQGPILYPMYRVYWDEHLRENSIYANDTDFGSALFSPFKQNENVYGPYYLCKDCELYNELHWLFYKDASNLEEYVVTSDELKEYMKRYKNTFPELKLLFDKYPEVLFEDSIDTDRQKFLYGYDENSESNPTCGLIIKEFTAGEEFDAGQGNAFVDTVSGQSAWNKFWFGTKYEDVSYSPIVTISETDLYLTPEAFSEKYYVHKDDAENFLKMANEAYSNNNVPVLFRHAVTDYYSSKARFDAISNENMSEVDGYVAQETMFFNFDIISLGFKSADGENEVVIGVVANPIDIINDITPPEDMPVEDEEWWQKIMLVLAIIVIVAVAIVLSIWCKPVIDIIWLGIQTIFNWLWWLITRPFVWIGNLFKRRK